MNTGQPFQTTQSLVDKHFAEAAQAFPSLRRTSNLTMTVSFPGLNNQFEIQIPSNYPASAPICTCGRSNVLTTIIQFWVPAFRLVHVLYSVFEMEKMKIVQIPDINTIEVAAALKNVPAQNIQTSEQRMSFLLNIPSVQRLYQIGRKASEDLQYFVKENETKAIKTRELQQKLTDMYEKITTYTQEIEKMESSMSQNEESAKETKKSELRAELAELQRKQEMLNRSPSSSIEARIIEKCNLTQRILYITRVLELI